MNKNSAVGALAAIITLAVVVAITFAVLLLPIMPGYKVTVSGKSTYNSLTGTWTVYYSGYTYEEDPYLLETLWVWDTWDTKHVVTLQGSTLRHTKELSTGSVSSWLGGVIDWNIQLRRIPEGTYTLTIDLYEKEGGFFFFPVGTWIKKASSTPTSITIG